MKLPSSRLETPESVNISAKSLNYHKICSSILTRALCELERNQFTVGNNVVITQCQMNADARLGGCTDNVDISTKVVCDESNTTCFIESEAKASSCHVLSSQKTLFKDEGDSIRDFLSKPYRLSASDWTTASAIGTQLYSFQAYTNGLVGVSQYLNKLYGYGLVRGNLHLRVELNANPFQQGKLLLHYAPYTDNMAYRLWGYNMCAMYQNPKVEITIGETSGELIVPYINPTTHFDVKNQLFDPQVFVNVLAPLRNGASATSTTVEVTYYVYWTDVEIAAPTMVQMENTHKISDGLKAAGKVKSVQGIPFVTPFMDTVQWALRITGNVLSAFGWSKPQILDNQMIISRSCWQYAGSSEGGSTSRPTTFNADAGLEVHHSSITKEDEMSLDFLYSVPFYKGTSVSNESPQTWLTSDAVGAALFNFQVSPSLFYYSASGTTVNTHTSTYRQGAPFWYLSNYFTVWRGSFIVTLKFSKTKFHSGRLQITYTPGTNVGTVPTVTTGIYSLRQIVDIREQDEISLELPYIVASDFLNMSEYSGYFSVLVLNPLKAPESVSTTVDILAFIRPGKDFEMAIPAISSKANTYTIQMDNDHALKLMTDTVIGSENKGEFNLTASKRCISERLMSVKQIISRYSVMLPRTASVINGGTYRNVTIYPWAIGGCCIDQASGALTSNQFVGDPYSLIASMYAFFRGGMRVGLVSDTETHIYATNPSDVSGMTVHMTAATTMNYGVFDATNTPLTSNMLPFQTRIPNDSHLGLVDIHVPFQSKYPVASTLDSHIDGGIDIIWDPTYCPKGTASFSCPAVFSAPYTSFYRGVADDFQLSFFMAAPPVLWSYA